MVNGQNFIEEKTMWSPTISSDELMHHGVDGQKWGVKNGPPYPLERGHKTSGKRKYRTDKGYHQKNQNGSKKRKTSQMSNDDLKREINRKELEQRYSDLSDAQVSRGRQKVMGMVRDYATVAAAVLTTAKLIETGRKILGR